MEINESERIKAVGKILSNSIKLGMLTTLAISPLPKREVGTRMGIAWSTAWLYLQELRDAGFTDEYFFTDGSASMVMVRLKERSIRIDLDKVKHVGTRKLAEGPGTQA